MLYELFVVDCEGAEEPPLWQPQFNLTNYLIISIVWSTSSNIPRNAERFICMWYFNLCGPISYFILKYFEMNILSRNNEQTLETEHKLPKRNNDKTEGS
jgi:hypothetical protein